jgi:uncharacterized protein (TIGR02099 family)
VLASEPGQEVVDRLLDEESQEHLAELEQFIGGVFRSSCRPSRCCTTGCEQYDVVLICPLAYGREGFRAHATFAGEAGHASLALVTDRPPTGDAWQGTTRLTARGLDLARVLGDNLPANYRLASGRLDLDIWTRWHAASPEHSRGEAALHDLVIGDPASARALRADRIAADIAVRRDAAGRTVGQASVDVAIDGRPWPTQQLAAAIGPDGAIDAFLPHVDLAPLRDLAVPLVGDPSGRATLQALRPHGRLHDLRLHLARPSEPATWRATTRFERLGIDAHDSIPRVEGVSGHAHLDGHHLRLDLESRDVTLAFRRLFREPLLLTHLAGRAELRATNGSWELRTDRLVADTPHIATLTRATLHQRRGGPLFLDLLSDFRDGDGAHAGLYYPSGIMDPQLVAWLDGAIVAGRVPRGQALFHGPVNDFAFERSRSGNFEVLFEAEDATLDYGDDWPPLESVAARIHFQRNQVDIVLREASLLGNRLDDATAHIASLDPVSSLKVRGTVTGPLTQQLAILETDALASRFGDIVNAVETSGDATLALDLEIPLRGDGDYVIDGRVALAGNRVALPDYAIALERATGELRFTADGIAARGVRARLLGTPVAIDVRTTADGKVRIGAGGRFGPEALRNRYPAAPIDRLSGTTAVAITLDLEPHGSGSVGGARLTLTSDLAGLAVALPEPLGKPAEAVRPLTLSLLFGDAGDLGELRYGTGVAARFTAIGDRVALAFGGEPAILLDRPGIRVTGVLERVDIDAWRAALDAIDGAPAGGALPEIEIDTRLNEARAGRLRVEDLQLVARHAGRRWDGRLVSPRVAGTFSVPVDLAGERFLVGLDRLHLDLPADEGLPAGGAMTAGSVAETVATIDVLPDTAGEPLAWAGGEIEIADLRLNDARLGSLRIAASRDDDGLALDALTLTGDTVSMEAAGRWWRGEEGQMTQLGGSADVADLGDLLAGLGYARQIEEAGGRIAFLLRWPGSPTAFTPALLDGKLSLELVDGSLTDLEPGVSRVFGLLNLNALARRLRLDFRDLYRKGLAFDRIEGDFMLAEGAATTGNLSLSGPSGKLLLRGAANLVDETLDQHVTVIPNLDSTLPIAGTLAGGPVAGVAVLIAQGVLSDEMDRINRFEYRLTGPWNRPEVERLETGGALSKLLQPLGGDSTDESGPGPPDTD